MKQLAANYNLVTILFIVLFCNCELLQARRLPPSLPWYIYTNNVHDLGPHLKQHVPIGYRNVVLFAQRVSIRTSIHDLTPHYLDYLVPFELTIVCETLNVVTSTYPKFIDLFGADAPDLVSRSPVTNSALQGKAGGDGGSIFIYAKQKIGGGKIYIDTTGGDGGKGQDGYIDGWGQGGDGGNGGRGGDAGRIVIVSMSSKSEMLKEYAKHDRRSGGFGGRGGRKGSVHQRDGQHGNSGTLSQLHYDYISSERAFYKSMPLTGHNFQRALDAELFRLMHAKHQNDINKIQTIQSTITFIRTAAANAGYNVIKQRCDNMLSLTVQRIQLPRNPIQVEKSKIKAHFDELCKVAYESSDVLPESFEHRLLTNQLLKQYSSYARTFNYLWDIFNTLNERYTAAKNLAKGLCAAAVCSLVRETSTFLHQKFHEYLVNNLLSKAKQESYIEAALDSGSAAAADGAVVTGSKVSIPATEVLEGLTLGAEDGVLAGVLGAEAVVAPEAIVVQVIALKAFMTLETFIRSELEEHRSNVAAYERNIHNHVRMGNNNYKKFIKDKRTKNQPKAKPQYLSGKTTPATRGTASDTNKDPLPKELWGKYVGVLEKCEPIDGRNNYVRATFDAILILLTTESGETIDLNNYAAMDAIQRLELNIQLEIYRFPLSRTLPSFIVSTSVSNHQSVHENNIGCWFQFDLTYNPSVSRDTYVLITSTIVTFVEEILSRTVSLDIDNYLYANIGNIKVLSEEAQQMILNRLGLSTEDTFRNDIERTTPVHVPPTSIDKIKVANVGQGSCNLLYNGNSLKAVYDLGYGKGRLTGWAENDLIQTIASSPMIIISHWDLDHYRYLLKYPDRILATPKAFIAPKFGSDQGVTVRKVVNSIPCQNLNLYGVRAGQSISGLGLTNIDIRTTTQTRGKNKNNVGAITLCVLDNDRRPLFLMPGDASFNFVAPQQNPSHATLCYLIATHHASLNGIGTIPVPAEANTHNQVIFSCGYGNSYGQSTNRAWPHYHARGWRGISTTEGSSNRFVEIQFNPLLRRTSPTCSV